MSYLQVTNLAKHFGKAVGVERVDLTAGQGELVALLGPSGCGKTTTLRMIAGFIPPTRGTIAIGGVDVTHLPPQGRDTAMVFQSYALFPHMTAAQNVGFGLEMRRVPAAERAERVARALDMVRLSAFADRLPRQLSGGQQQRVALARALVVNPGLLLLDEPLSNLDARLRTEVREEIRELQQRLGLTTIMVTHDQEEALAMADRLAVMDVGRVRQIGTAQEIYEAPADRFVADFVGRCNLIEGRVAGDRFVSGAGLAIACANPAGMSGPAVLAIRPERIHLRPAASPEGLPVQLRKLTYLGAQVECHLSLAGETLVVVMPNGPEAAALAAAPPGQELRALWSTGDARALPR